MAFPSIDRETLRAIAWELGILALVAAALWPVWSIRWLPLQDLPQHLAAIRVLTDYSDPALNFQDYFKLTPFQTQYLGYYTAVGLLSLAFEVDVANRIFLSICLAATPYALRYLLYRLERPAYLALFVFPLLHNTFLLLGFINFIAAIPLMLWGLGLAARLRDDYAWPVAVGLGVVGFVCFYMHVVPFAFLAVGTGLLGIQNSIRQTLEVWLPMLPPGLVSIAWTFYSPAGRSTQEAMGEGAAYQPWPDAFRELPDWLTNVTLETTPVDLLIAYGLLAMLAVVAGVHYGRGQSARDRVGELVPAFQRVALLAPLAMLGYFALPNSYDWIWPISQRFALIGIILAIPAIPTVRNAFASVLIVGLTVVSLAHYSHVEHKYRQFSQQEVGNLREALDTIPPGKRVAGLIFDRRSKHVRYAPFIHYAAYYQAYKGGAVMFTFADFPQSPFRFREDDRPPKVPPRWEWEPRRVNPKESLSWYHYVLARGGPGKIEHQKQAWAEIYRGDRWSVWRNRDRTEAAYHSNTE